jgi:threonine aldolase
MSIITIDYFSDTNTDIPLEIRKVMFEAKVGNEVAGEDPNVNELLRKLCSLMGKEAAIFLPSGTMSNVIAYKAHLQLPGDYIILDETSHPLVVQSGLIGGVVNASIIPIKGNRGIFKAEQINKFVRAPVLRNIPRSRLVSLEQTTNFGGGAIWPLEEIESISNLCKANNVSMHLDGARLFNAHVATQIPLKKYCKYFDSVFIDFTKGLGVPMGSVLLGSKQFIEKCWYYKFQLGGGMHQVGMLAAACIYALENNIERLEEDHKRAKLLANLLSEIQEIDINPELFTTNIVFFSLNDKTRVSPSDFVAALNKQEIRMLIIEDRIRAITHMRITDDNVYQTIYQIRKILEVDSK